MNYDDVCSNCGGTGEIVVYETYYWLQPDMTRKPVRTYPVGYDPCPVCQPRGFTQ